MIRNPVLLSWLVVWALAPIALAQEAPAANATLSGRVVDAQGRPIAGAVVAFAPREAVTTAQLLAEAKVRTGADGRFALAVPTLPETDELASPSLQVAAKGMAATAPAVAWKLKPPTAGSEVRPRLDTDVGDVVLPEGARLFGRVRDGDGKGVGGVVVTMRDLFDGHRVLGGSQSQAHCRAVSNASGIFELPCGLPSGAIVEFAAKGFFRQTLHAVAAGSPLEVVLAPSGRIAGRVVDEKGGLVAGALVRASYERSGGTTRVRTGADGTFELPLEQPGRFRVSAQRPRAPGGAATRRSAAEYAMSELLAEPVANLELTLSAPKVVAAGSLRVQAVEAASGKPVSGFRAIAIWQPFALQNAAYLDYLATTWLQGTPAGDGPEVLVKGPGENDSRTGAVRVEAPGFAPATERDVEWSDDDAKGDKKPIVVKLVREATIAGRVVDERTGAPLAGVVVWAMRKQDRSMGWYGGTEAPENAFVTAADGAFTLAQLGDGDWMVRYQHRERPAPMPIDVKLAAEQQRAGLELKLAAGARVAGRVTGIAIPPGSKLFLHPLATPRFGGPQTFSSVSMDGANDGKVAIAADGSFAFPGIALMNYFLVAELPSPPRCGGALYVPIEPLRVRPDGVQRDFDAGQDLPGRIRGSVRFPKAEPRGGVYVVVAEQVSDNPDEQVYRSSQQFLGPRAFVQADGSFVLPVTRGTHQLTVIDAASGVLLATPGDRIVVPAGGDLQHDVSVPLTEVAIALQPDAQAGPLVWMDRLEVRHVPAQPAQNGGVMIMGGNDEYDMGVGLPIAAGTTSVRLWLPEGKVTLLARSSASSLRRPQEQRAPLGPLAKEEFELAAADKAVRDVVLKVGPPPELAAPTPKADGDAAKKK